MGYFESGFLYYRMFFDGEVGRYYVTGAAKLDDTHKALAILKCSASWEPGLYIYYTVAGDGTPLVIEDFSSISYYLSSWANDYSYYNGYRTEDNYEYVDPTPYFEPISGGYMDSMYMQDPIGWGYNVYDTATLPIFNVDTQDGVDAFNTYQATGDFSGAENASELATDDIVHETKVDFISRPFVKPIHVVQGDDSIAKVAVALYFNGVLTSINDILEAATTSTIKIRCRDKLGNTVYSDTLGLNTEGNKLYFLITDDLTRTHGYVEIVVEIKCDDQIAQSSVILLDVDRNPLKEVE